jgi:hypothetical protein
VPLSLLPLAVDREFAIVAALVALIVAALSVSAGAWVLLAREWRRDRNDGSLVQGDTELAPNSEPELRTD